MGEVYVYQISLLCTWAQRPVRDGCLSKQQEAVAWFYGRFRGILDHGADVFPVQMHECPIIWDTGEWGSSTSQKFVALYAPAC